MVEKYDVITFSETDKVIVIDKCKLDGIFYILVNEILPDESDLTDVFKILEIHEEDGTLEKVSDPERLEQLMKKFARKIKRKMRDKVITSVKM